MKETSVDIVYNYPSSNNATNLYSRRYQGEKNICTWVMVILIASPSLVYAAPGGPGGHGGYGRPHLSHAPNSPRSPRLDFLPALATTLILGGLTYYVVNDAYYRKQGTEYILVDSPTNISSNLNVVDYNNKRYYVRNGSYYQKDIDGNYIEVPRPAGL